MSQLGEGNRILGSARMSIGICLEICLEIRRALQKRFSRQNFGYPNHISLKLQYHLYSDHKYLCTKFQEVICCREAVIGNGA